MRIETAFREYRTDMTRAMTAFSSDEHAAADGVSRAFTQALVHKAELEAMPDRAMRAWLYAAARNSVIDIKRRQARFTYFPDGDPDTQCAPPEADTVDQWFVAGLLDKLPPALRAPVRMKYFRRMNAAQIGASLGLPAATVRTRLRRAMHLMREMCLTNGDKL